MRLLEDLEAPEDPPSLRGDGRGREVSIADLAGRAARVALDERREVRLRDEARPFHHVHEGERALAQQTHREAELFAADDLRGTRQPCRDEPMVEVRTAHLQFTAQWIEPYDAALEVLMDAVRGLEEQGVPGRLDVVELRDKHIREKAQHGAEAIGGLVAQSAQLSD